MRWHLWATAVAAYAAELRLETFVTVELTLDNLPLTLRAHVDDDPGKAAELFCKDAIPLSLECKDRFAAALRAEQALVRIRTGRVKPQEPRKQVPAPPKLVWLSEPMARAPSKNVALSIVVGPCSPPTKNTPSPPPCPLRESRLWVITPRPLATNTSSID